MSLACPAEVRAPEFNDKRTGPASAMAFKLTEWAQARRRAVNAPRLVAAVGAGARFEHGRLVERPEGAAA
ncbi:hypothetical protein BJY14_001367 [Actinomadura luteofluorescens]|uniref:Uncharacterized protein n=1 Tax=Actinomadura luteofluorescens TaxID=46163 RepID=A0A7Y9JFK3_9ACTN|nr:hypothetical protein [Actinomadura luteofluorescens]NYD45384.1 hypothetical protein [Actinomadura luteofluorescens]